MRYSDCVFRVNTLCRVHLNEDNGAVNIYHGSVGKGLLGKPLKCEGAEGCLEVGHKSWSS